MEIEKKDINTFFEYDKQELFSVLLDLLGFFDELCKRYNLSYFAQGGTMLGAVRHKGFIPWDDDIDLAMMRDDYNRLLKLIETEKLPDPYEFLTPLTDAEYGKGLIRLCNKQTTAISINNGIFNYNHGIFIDIFPLDSIPDSRAELKAYKLIVDSHSKLLMLMCRFHMGKDGTLEMNRRHRVLFWLVYPLYKSGLLTKERVFNNFTKAASVFEGKGKKRICLSTFEIANRYINYKKDYEVRIIDMPFENTSVPVPETYDTILKNHYGEKYMTPIHERSMHGETLYSTTIPYKDFMRLYHKELRELWINFRRRRKTR